MTLQQTLTNFGEIFEFVIGLVGNVIDLIIANPVLFVGLGIGLAYTAINLTKRLI